MVILGTFRDQSALFGLLHWLPWLALDLRWIAIWDF
jgi:hypothetical protein